MLSIWPPEGRDETLFDDDALCSPCLCGVRCDGKAHCARAFILRTKSFWGIYDNRVGACVGALLSTLLTRVRGFESDNILEIYAQNFSGSFREKKNELRLKYGTGRDGSDYS